jgi:hypothetical protein
MIRAGGITGAVNHAIKQRVRAAPVSQRERKPRYVSGTCLIRFTSARPPLRIYSVSDPQVR